MALGHYNDYSVTRRWEFLSSIIVSWAHVVYAAREHAKAQLHVLTRSHTGTSRQGSATSPQKEFSGKLSDKVKVGILSP